MLKKIVYNTTALMLTSTLIVGATYTLAYYVLLLKYKGGLF